MVVGVAIPDPAYAMRLTQACDAAYPRCPAMNHGRLRWIAEEMDRRFGVKPSAQSINRWLHGENKPREKASAKLAEILEVDPVWLFLGVQGELTPRERKAQTAMVDGAVHIVHGLIQLDGGHPAIPDEDDARAKREHIDLYAVIKAANYAIHVALATESGGKWKFAFPANLDGVIVIGVIREGLSFRLIELTDSLVSDNSAKGVGRTHSVLLDDETVNANLLTGFSKRL